MLGKLRYFSFFLALILPATTFAQGLCDDQLQSELDFCIADATDSCLAEFPECDGGAGGDSDVADAIFENIADSCCEKSSKSKKLLCLTGALGAMKRSGKQLFARDVSNSIKSEIKGILNEVKSSGECYPDEDEEDDGDDDDSDDEDPDEEF